MKKLFAALAVSALFASTVAHAELTHDAKNDIARGAASALVTKYVTDKTHSKVLGVGSALVANYVETRVFEKHHMNGHDAVTSVAGSGVGLMFSKKF